jgi:transposase
MAAFSVYHCEFRQSELLPLYVRFGAEIERLNKQVKEPACQRPGASLQMTHPGVGPLTALATDVFLGDSARFVDSKYLAGYVRPIPPEYSSRGRQQLGGLIKQRHRRLAE